MSEKLLASFSISARYYAHVSDDGKLRIWDVPSNVLKQEYTPDVHLTSPYTELRWISSSKKLDSLDANRKRKLDGNIENEYIILGSRSGSIFVYSVSSCNVISVFDNGHSSRVNSISWTKNKPNQIFSSSDDSFIIQWSLDNHSIKKKWKSGKVSCIAISSNGLALISAKKEIKWWDISGEEEVLRKTFIGHSTDVYCLSFVQISGNSFVLSAAVGNKLIHAWLLNDNVEERQAVLTFAMDDILVSISTWNNDEELQITANSRLGILHFYQCKIMKQKNAKPIKPKLKVQIAAESDSKNDQVEQIPIVNVAFYDEKSALIVYGTDNIFSFEKLDLKCSDKCMFIVRKDPKKKILADKEQIASKILATSTSKNVQYAHPDTVNGYISVNNRKAQKRSNDIDKKNEVPLELRLENLIVNVPSTATTVPTSDSLVHLLLQGLKSRDSKLLLDVLLNQDENVIKTTVTRLPVEAVIPLSIELTSMLQRKRVESNSAIKWLKQLLITHAAHLVSNPEISDVFAPIFPLIESKYNVLGPLCKLIGKLEMMVEQIRNRTDESQKSLQNINLQPKLIYQDEDSEEEEEDENDVFREETVCNEDSDDHWDEISEIDIDSGQEQDLENIDE